MRSVEVREYRIGGGGVSCGKVVLNRYEIWTAICRAALVKAGLPSGGDFGIDNRWTDDVPEALSFEMFDGYAKIVIREVAPENETIEQRHVRQVRQILGETRRTVLDALEGKLAAARPELEKIVAGLGIEEPLDELDAALGAMTPEDVRAEQEMAEGRFAEDGFTRDELVARRARICTVCLMTTEDRPSSKYCEKVRGGDPDGKNQHDWHRLDVEGGVKAWHRRLQTFAQTR